LRRGEKYRVKASFVDADGAQHTTGEEWTFIGCKFSPFDNEYTLCVRIPSGEIKLLPLLADPQRQERYDVIKNFNKYVDHC